MRGLKKNAQAERGDARCVRQIGEGGSFDIGRRRLPWGDDVTCRADILSEPAAGRGITEQFLGSNAC
jgi:hypothetical protein